MFDSGFRLVAYDGGVTFEAGEISTKEACQLGQFLTKRFGTVAITGKSVSPGAIDGTRFCLPEELPNNQIPDPDGKYAHLKDAESAEKSFYEDQAKIKELRERRSAQTVPIKVGDPNLAYSAPSASGDGKQRIAGLEVMDLGALAQRDGMMRRT